MRFGASSGFSLKPSGYRSEGKHLISSQLRISLLAGYWHTEGNRIISNRHTAVRITGANWSGLETSFAVPGGLERQDYHAILRAAAEAGYNTVRIPFSNQVVEDPTVPTAIRFENEHGSINADLEGLDSLQILDRIVSAAGELGLKVILDNHRSEAGSSAEESGLWYTERYPEAAWITDWVALARRYQSNPAVIGFDLRNEPHNAATNGACWNCGGARDWHLAAQRAGNAILAINPKVLIFVEGTDVVDGNSYWWGGNLMGVRRSPIHLNVPNQLVYSAHVYGPTEYQQPWFNARSTPSSLVANFREKWGYVDESGIAPVWLGEFGAPNDERTLTGSEPGSEGQWFTSLVSYLQSHPSIGWSYWGLNGDDRYALLDINYSGPASPIKSRLLASIRRTADTQPPFQASYTPTVVVPASSPETYAEQVPALALASSFTPPPDITPLFPPPLNLQTAFAIGATNGHHSHKPAKSWSASPGAAIAEQVRLDTQQAMRTLPGSQ